VDQTVDEIVRLLRAYGAKSISIDYDAGEPVGLRFSVPMTGLGERPIALPVRVQKVLERLKALAKAREIRPEYATPDQAARTAWRNVRDLVDASLSLVRWEQADLAEIAAGYLTDDRGQTLYEVLIRNGRLLTGGSES
jgi:chorismate mutase